MSTNVLKNLPGKFDIERHSPSILYISASLAMSTSVLKALPGKLDIERHSPSILCLLEALGHAGQVPKSRTVTSTFSVSSAANFYKYFGLRSGMKNCQASSGSKLFCALMLLMKDFFKKVDFEKETQTTTKCGRQAAW